MKKRSGFTLVELLAVIVILAVILIIAMPKITDTIKNSKIASFESSAKTIAAQAEKKLMENEILEDTGSINCSDVVKLNDTDYDSCSITFDGNTAKVTLVGKGKFEGLKITNGTKDNAAAVETTGDSSTKTATEYIKELYNDVSSRTANGLKKDNTSDANIRYEGGNPNNYVSFNDELWRIIGVFGDKIKLIRSEQLGILSWDGSDSSVNSGFGVNEWSQADLKEYLNTMYYGGTSVTCYDGNDNKITTCPTDSLNSTAKSMINNYTWNTGAINFEDTTIVNQDDDIDTVAFYNAERGSVNGKMCTSGNYCNDIVERKTTWQGYVALPYVTDWAYASATDGCEINMQQKDSKSVYICKNDNWMNYGNLTLYLSPSARSNGAYYVCIVGGAGFVARGYASAGEFVFPSVYLNSDVKITSGSGTSSDPYILGV